jgi:lipid-A-disaccharide synthase-like uncharacterized protein
MSPLLEQRQSAWRPAPAMLVILAALALAMALGQSSSPPRATRQPFKVDLEGVRRVELSRDGQGSYVYELTLWNGQTQTLDPQAFAQRVFDEGAHRPWYQKLLNITSTAGIVWVSVGMLGQLLFTGRMLVQWLLSEKEKRSVVPPVFWWMSLGGGVLLLVYFLWRKDIVGVIGQGTGTVIYVRNLMLIYARRHEAPAPAAAAPGPSGT